MPLTIELTIVDADSGKALPGAAVYLWHCDRIGRYSMYSSGLGSENYLRGVQVADAKGALRFASIFRDGVDRQLATVTGSTSAGSTARLTVGV